MSKLRIGSLGAASILEAALVKPAREVDDVELLAVAARDPLRARMYAAEHSVPRVHDSYEAMLADPDLDAVYIPLPNGLHARWAIAALDAGKHVLCEKPFAANAAEAQRVADHAATTPDLVVMEAFHWRYHPLAARAREVIASGELGAIRRIDAAMCFPLFKRGDIRWRYDLAGGALMDAGCYPIHMVRSLLAEEPEVIAAEAKLRAPDVDRSMQVDLAFPSGARGRVTASMWSSSVLRMGIRVEGEHGWLRVFNPVAPQYFHRFTVQSREGRRSEKVRGDATYVHQLRAFADAVLRGAPTLTPPSDSVANMRVIDAAYTAAGLPLRKGATDPQP